MLLKRAILILAFVGAQFQVAVPAETESQAYFPVRMYRNFKKDVALVRECFFGSTCTPKKLGQARRAGLRIIAKVGAAFVITYFGPRVYRWLVNDGGAIKPGDLNNGNAQGNKASVGAQVDDGKEAVTGSPEENYVINKLKKKNLGIITQEDVSTVIKLANKKSDLQSEFYNLSIDDQRGISLHEVAVALKDWRDSQRDKIEQEKKLQKEEALRLQQKAQEMQLKQEQERLEKEALLREQQAKQKEQQPLAQPVQNETDEQYAKRELEKSIKELNMSKQDKQRFTQHIDQFVNFVVRDSSRNTEKQLQDSINRTSADIAHMTKYELSNAAQSNKSNADYTSVEHEIEKLKFAKRQGKISLQLKKRRQAQNNN